jgi:hypothetical protein
VLLLRFLFFYLNSGLIQIVEKIELNKKFDIIYLATIFSFIPNIFNIFINLSINKKYLEEVKRFLAIPILSSQNSTAGTTNNRAGSFYQSQRSSGIHKGLTRKFK